MRYGNSRPNSKKSLKNKIKKAEGIIDTVSKIDLEKCSNQKKSYIERVGDSAVDEVISIQDRIYKGNYSLKPFKKRRNISVDKLKEMILEDIQKRSTSKEWLERRVSKEYYARTLEVKEHLVEQVFQILNREGILSQRKPNFAHDTNRNKTFPGCESGWAEDTYDILINIEEEF